VYEYAPPPGLVEGVCFDFPYAITFISSGRILTAPWPELPSPLVVARHYLPGQVSQGFVGGKNQASERENRKRFAHSTSNR
jgi:hypothetical protein